MKTANLGDHFYWGEQLTKCYGINRGEKSIIFKITEMVKCPHCEKDHPIEVQHDIIEASPLFQENAKPVQTIK